MSILFLLGISQTDFAQTSTLSGIVSDTFEKKPLQDAVISLVVEKDTTLYQFTRTGNDGHFNIGPISPGSYLLIVSYPGYVDFAEPLQVAGSSLIDFHTISLIPASKLLEEVIVKQNRAIRMRGDTVEYTADSFKVRDGASVKELLRNMPGLQVDNKGQVTAQGQKVEKVLVDGEEFFSDDPAVVIENLRADAIDKVQSFDKKSDQAEFTGVDDGSRSKTLNLVLKEDKKKGYFGKVVIGGGTAERYSEEAMLNFFKGKKKFSVYGIASNTGKTGLGWQDRSKFGQEEDFGDATVEMGAGFIMINGEGDGDFSDWSNTYYDEGIPKTIKAGAHFSNKWNQDKEHLNANYSIRNMDVSAAGNSLTKYILPDSAYYSKENHSSNSRQTQQLISSAFDLNIDSFASLRFKFNGKMEHKDNATLSNTESDDELLQAVNRNSRSNNSVTDTKTFLGSILWRQKFRKSKRTLSWVVSHKYNENNATGYLYSTTDFFDNNGFPFQRDTVDQYKTNDAITQTTSSKMVFTEPIGKKSILEFNLAISHISSDADRKSFDKDNGKYTILNSLFSNKYGLQYQSNSAGIKYQYTGKKLIANLGSNIGVSTYIQKDATGSKVNEFRYTNLFPTSRITYKFSSQRSLNINYSGSPQPPGIEQIQPVRENTNPLFIQVGNPELKQSFRHNLSLFFSDFKMLSGRNIWINGSISPVQDAIVSSQVTVNGVTTQQYINTRGNYNYWFYGSYGTKFKKTDMRVGVNLNFNGARYVNFVNTVKNTSLSNSTGVSFYLNQYKEDKFSINMVTGITYNHSVSSISAKKNNFLSQEHSADINFFITKQLQIGTNVNVYLREKTDAFDNNNNFTVWDANISYKVFKNRNGVFKLEINDILKERRGFDRSYTSNMIYERNYNMLSRYALLSFTWNFTKNPGSTK